MEQVSIPSTFLISELRTDYWQDSVIGANALISSGRIVHIMFIFALSCVSRAVVVAPREGQTWIHRLSNALIITSTFNRTQNFFRTPLLDAQ